MACQWDSKSQKQAPYTLATVIEGVGRLITEDAAKADVATFDLKKAIALSFRQIFRVGVLKVI